jgi:O-antigen/teichoic acid export membrane protein
VTDANSLQSQDNTAADVGSRTRRGITWSFVGAAVTNGMRIVVLAVLGRLLTDTEFGIVAAAVSVNAIVFGIRDLGIGLALVQRKDLDNAHLTTAFATSTYLGVVLSVGLVIAAPYIGRAYGIVESVEVIRGLAVMFAIRSVATTSRMLAQRAMNFRLITIVDTVAFTAGSIASMVAAGLGGGAWSLVLGYLVEESLQAVLYLRFSPAKISFRIDRARLRDLLRFGAGHSVVLAANLVATFGDNIIVGNRRGAKALGNYSRAYDLIKFPSMVFDAIVGNVLFPAFAKLQDDHANLGATFRRVTFVNSLVLLPASGALIVVAPEAIHVILGAGWSDAVIPFQILAVSIFFRTSLKLGGIVAQAAGAVNAVAIAYIIYMIVLVGGAAISIRWGVVGVATTTAAALIVASIECSYLGIRLSRSSALSFLSAHVPGVLLTMIVVAVTLPMATAMRHAALHPAIVFGAVAVVSMVICCAGVWIGTVRGRGEFAWLGMELRRVLRRGRR